MDEVVVLSCKDLVEAVDNSIYARRAGCRRVYDKKRVQILRHSWSGVYYDYIWEYFATHELEIGDEKYEVKDAVVGDSIYIYRNKDGLLERIIVLQSSSRKKDVSDTDVEIEWRRKITEALRNKRVEFYKKYLDKQDLIFIENYSAYPHAYSMYANEICDSAIGSHVTDLHKIANDYYYKKISGKGFVDKEEKKRWLSLPPDFQDYIIGIDKKMIDVFPTGFTVRLLLKSGKDFKEQKKFVKEHGRDILKFVMQEIPYYPKIMKKIGDLKFYKPVEIIVLRSNELDIKFEVKGDIENAGA